MENKILLLVMVTITVVVGGIIFSSGIFVQTTEVDNKFFSGTIPERVHENKNNVVPELFIVYDSTNNNRYVFTMADSLKFFAETYEEWGAKKIASQTYNGIEWDIYVITPPVYKKIFNESAYAYLCVASGKNGDYSVEVSSLILKADEELESGLFTKYTKPLLESIEFKDPENPPKEYQVIGVEKEEDLDYVKKYGWDSYWGLSIL